MYEKVGGDRNFEPQKHTQSNKITFPFGDCIFSEDLHPDVDPNKSDFFTRVPRSPPATSTRSRFESGFEGVTLMEVDCLFPLDERSSIVPDK